MDKHINWQDPEKPPEMNFARIMCLVLGGAGLVIAALVGMADRSIAEFYVFGLMFGILFCLGLAARPRRWFSSADEVPSPNTPWWKRSVDREYRFGNKPFVSLSRVDYALLSIVLLANLLLVPVLVPILPKLGEIPGWFTPACIIVCLPLFCAYYWQLKMTDRLGWYSPLLMFSAGLFLYVWGYRLDDRDAMISGVLAVDLGFWSAIRLVTMRFLPRSTA
jgi:uncharacterized membrane protein YhdT